jgi:hypothetical protein
MAGAPDLVRGLEAARPRRQHLRHRQHARHRVVAPHGRARGRELHADVVRRSEVARHRAEDVVPFDAGLAREGLRRRLQLREVVQMVLDHVIHFLGREVRGIDAEEVAAVVQLRGQRARRLHRPAVGLVERQHRAGHAGVVGQLAHVAQRHRLLLEQRVAEHLLQVGGEPRAGVVRERLQLHLEHRGHLHQQMRRHRPLLVLDEVEVAGGDLQPRGQLGLRQLLPAAHGADFRAEAEGGGAHDLAPGTRCSLHEVETCVSGCADLQPIDSMTSIGARSFTA